MSTQQKTAFVMGAGSAGIAAAIELATAGWKVWIAEPSGVGGTCLWTGCVPKKAIYLSSMAYRALGRDPGFGIEPGSAGYDWKQVMAWKRRSQTEVAGDQEKLLASNGIEHVPGVARFVSPDEVATDSTKYRPDAVVIATGARTVLPPLPGVELADTSGSALSYREVPESLLIVGAGYIGMEFAAAYALMGSRVTLVAHGPRILPMFDSELTDISHRMLAEAGVDIRLETSVTALEGIRGDIRTVASGPDGAEERIESQHVLVAVGRRAEVGGLGLGLAGVEVDGRGRLVLDEAQRTTNPRVWACGDAAGTIQLKPASELAGRAVGRSIATGVPQPVRYDTVPSTVFTLPQLAQVGLMEDAAAERGIACRVHRQPLDRLPAGIIDDEPQGVVKLVFADGQEAGGDGQDAASGGRLLGAAIAAPTAAELIYACALGIRTGATLRDMEETVGIHAAFSEGVNFAALAPADPAARSAGGSPSGSPSRS